jgi:hypothetical protein
MCGVSLSFSAQYYSPVSSFLGLLNDDVDITQVPARMTIVSSTDYGYFKYYRRYPCPE